VGEADPMDTSYRLPFEIECHKKPDHFEFCRIFFKSVSPFPKHVLFGMDNVHFAPYKQFMEDNAGMVVGRSDKLIIFVANKKTRASDRLTVDLEPYWPADLRPGEIKTKLAEIDLTAAIAGLV
jgi:hypothetical protein